MDEWDRLYDVEDMEEDEFWIAELFEPVRPEKTSGNSFFRFRVVVCLMIFFG